MSCQRMIRMLSARQDGELSPDRERGLELHLHDCAACRDEWQALQQVVQGLRLAQPPAVDPFFPTRVMAGLPARPAGHTRLIQAAAYGLAFAMIFAGGLFLQVAANNQPAAGRAIAPTFSAVLLESQDLGLLSVQDATLSLFEENAHE
jgi:anti-sigma factor RsiW